MVFNATFNNITFGCIKYTSPRARFELTTLVVIGTDCTGSCESDYHRLRPRRPPPKRSI